MRASILSAERLGKRFGVVEAVKDATFNVRPGTITAFLGENGAGKTTVLRLLLGFLRPDSGRFSLAAVRVGYVPERPAFFPWLRGGQNLRCTARAFGLSRCGLDREIESVCRRIAFDPRLLARRVHTYSLGNQKKFSYLQNLIVQPDLLIVDEPFSALDPLAIKRTRDLFQELKGKGKTLLLSSHLISEIERICDEFIVIKKGRIIFQECLSRLKHEFSLVSLPKNSWPRKVLDPELSQVRETENGIQILVSRFRLRESSVSWPEGTEISRPDLESLYFFLSGL
jgi:ABC-2 type transport system ATP-binding protein